MELPAHDFPLYGLDVLYQIRLSGRRVLLIHPERNRAVQKHMELRERLHSMGVLGVASAGSLKGQFGVRAQEAVWELVDSGLIQSVSSDGHSVRQRPLGLAWVRELVIRRYGVAVGAWMMDAVPSDGQEVELAPRRRVRWRRWFCVKKMVSCERAWAWKNAGSVSGVAAPQKGCLMRRLGMSAVGVPWGLSCAMLGFTGSPSIMVDPRAF